MSKYKRPMKSIRFRTGDRVYFKSGSDDAGADGFVRGVIIDLDMNIGQGMYRVKDAKGKVHMYSGNEGLMGDNWVDVDAMVEL